jgi:predicted RNA-binding protein
MLKYLISHKRAYKAEIAESLAYSNNRDTSQIENIQEFMHVPVYDVLVRHGFVTENKNARYFHQREYAMNVELNEYQQFEIDQILQKKIEEWNKNHGIPENQFENPGIDWNQHRELLREVKYWIWSVTEENWEILKKEKIWGTKVRPEEIMQWVLPKDQIIFYVIGTKSFKGIFEIVGEWFDDSKKFRWFDEIERREIIYRSAIRIRPIILGTAKIDDLEELSIFSNKDQNLRNLVLKGESGYPSNRRQSIPMMDFEIIRKTLETHPSEYVNVEKIERVQERSSIPTQLEDHSETHPSEYVNVEKIERVQERSSIPTQLEDHSEISNLVITKTFDMRYDRLIIKEIEVLKEDIILKGERLTNDELSEKFGVGNMGGIRYSKRNNLIVLCETESGHYHDDRSIDFGLFFYTGEGITGDQAITGGNYRLIHSEKIPIFYFVEEPQEPGKKKRGALDNIYRFVAKVRYQKHIMKTENDVTGQPRLVIKFLLETEN